MKKVFLVFFLILLSAWSAIFLAITFSAVFLDQTVLNDPIFKKEWWEDALLIPFAWGILVFLYTIKSKKKMENFWPTKKLGE